MIIADANLLVYLWLPGPELENARAVLKKDKNWYSVPFWISEFRNALAKYLRAGLISSEEAYGILQDAERMMSERVYPVTSEQVMHHVRSSQCSAYDCEYVALAYERKCPLVTGDKRVLREFPAISVSLADFIR